jgi:cell division septal protein FtsQ
MSRQTTIDDVLLRRTSDAADREVLVLPEEEYLPHEAKLSDGLGQALRENLRVWLPLLFLTVGLAGFAGFFAVVFFFRPVFVVEYVLVAPPPSDELGSVYETLDAVRGANLLTIDLVALEADIRSNPWVEQVTVKRVFPRTLKVGLNGRRPVALVNGYLVDGKGFVLAKDSRQTAHMPWVWVNSLSEEGLRPGRHLQESAALEALSALTRQPDDAVAPPVEDQPRNLLEAIAFTMENEGD